MHGDIGLLMLNSQTLHMSADMFEYSANDFYNQFKRFLFLIEMFCQKSEAVFESQAT